MLLAALLLTATCASGRGDPHLRLRTARSRQTGPTVGALHFVGNETFDEQILSQYMVTRESGLIRKSYYDRRTLLRDLENLRRFYAARGFLEADVALEDIRANADTTAVELLVGIYEGDRWTVEDVSLEGAHDVTEQELLGVVRLVAGAPFEPGRLLSDKRAILEEYAKRSYLDANVDQVAERDDERRVATISYRIREREPATIASIDVVGDEKTRQYVVERELTFEVGESFDFEKMGESQANIYRTGLFHSVWIEPAREDTGRAEKGVLVRVNERPSGDMDFTVSYAALDGLEAGAGIVNRNVQGQATTLGVNGRYGERAREVRASLGDPWFLGWRIAAETSAMYGWHDEESFLAETTGADFVLTKELGLNLTVEGGYGFERTIVLEADDDREGPGTNYTSDLLFAVIYDSRNEILSADRGMYARAEVDFASSKLGGTNDFVRYDLTWRGYKSAGHGRVAALDLRGGWIKPQGDGSDVPVNERYLAGGDGSVRGFERNSLGPLDTDGKPKGGRAIVVARGEVRFHVYKNLRAAVFADAGQVFDDFGAVRASQLAVGAGAGLRFETRIGVLRFDVATPISEDGAPQYYFGVGQAF